MRQILKNRIAVAAMLLIGIAFAAPTNAATRPTDENIDLWVASALRQDPRIHSIDIAVSSHDGIVTLSGGVDSLAARTFADKEAKKIRGVLGVINELEVRPADRTDEQIREAITRRLEDSTAIVSTNLHATSLEGNVILTGNVDSWSEKQQARLLASEVAGVKHVTNDIVVKWTPKRTDREIQNDVRASLSRDVYLTDMPFSVTVEDGVVTLGGTVGNAYQRDRAENDARWGGGVKDIRDEIVVDWAAKPDVVAVPLVTTDTQIEARVRAELDQDWRLDPSKITIHADMGAVTLAGTVYSRDERRIAESDARDVVGVAWVNDQIMVQVDTRDDRLIRDEVMFRLDTDYATADLGLQASVHHGVVTLTGQTIGWFERSRAAILAAGVNGVREVDNLITVAPESWKLDADLTKTISRHLTWNWKTWRVHDNIGVAVHNGVATLTGAVDSWAERSEATDVALGTPGVWKVDNRITVDGYTYPWSEYYYKLPYEYSLKDSK